MMIHAVDALLPPQEVIGILRKNHLAAGIHNSLIIVPGQHAVIVNPQDFPAGIGAVAVGTVAVQQRKVPCGQGHALIVNVAVPLSPHHI